MSEAEILSLVDAGLYKDAAAVIDSLSKPNKSLKVLRAHLEEHVASGTRARAAAESLLREGLPVSDKAGCYEVIARAAMSLGQVEPGLRAMRAALALAAEAQSPKSLREATNQLERAAIERALTAANGNNDDAARALGLSRKDLYLEWQRRGLK